MSKITLLHACSLVLLLGPALACEKDDDDGSGDDANDSAMTSNDDGDDGQETEADDFGDDTGGDSPPSTSTTSTSTTSTTSTTDAGDGDDSSAACESFFDCPTVTCECPDGNVEIASCLDGMCATADDCADPPHNACEG